MLLCCLLHHHLGRENTQHLLVGIRAPVRDTDNMRNYFKCQKRKDKEQYLKTCKNAREAMSTSKLKNQKEWLM